MHITRENIMVAKDSGAEPIVPLGVLTGVMECEISWRHQEMIAAHPQRGKLKVEIRGGCPEVEKDEALRLIEKKSRRRKERD